MIYLILLVLAVISGALALLWTWSAVNLVSVASRVLGSSLQRSRWSGDISHSFRVALLLGTSLEAFANVAMISGPSWIPTVILIFPGSSIFYLVPTVLLERLPEPVLYFIGSSWTVLVWSSLFWAARSVANRLSLEVGNALSAA